MVDLYYSQFLLELLFIQDNICPWWTLAKLIPVVLMNLVNISEITIFINFTLLNRHIGWRCTVCLITVLFPLFMKPSALASEHTAHHVLEPYTTTAHQHYD